MQELEKKIKYLKEFIKEKTDQGTANYLGTEIREICGMVESEQLSLYGVSHQRELLKALKKNHLHNFGNTPISIEELDDYIESL